MSEIGTTDIPAGKADERASASPSAPVSPRRRPRVGDLLYNYSVLWALLIEIAVFSILKPSTFFTTANAKSIISSQAILLIVAVGLTVPLAVGEFDLSISATVVLSQVVMASLVLNHHWSLVPAVIAGILACSAVGAVNALFVVRVGVSSFITTLGMSTLVAGIVYKISDSGPVAGVTPTLGEIAGNSFLGIQLVFWYGLAAAAVLWFILSRTPVGRRMYFTGANPEAARLNGVATGRLKAGALITSAVVAGVAGILYAGVFGDADPNVGSNFLLPAFAATFLGATAVTPGRFNAWGSLLSVYLVGTGITGLTLVTEQASWISYVFNGGILIVAVGAQRLVAVRRERATQNADD